MLIELSKSAVVFTAAAPRPIIAALPLDILRPMLCAPSPTFPVTSAILASFAFADMLSLVRFLSSCSVATISLQSAWYCSWLILPFCPTSVAACFSASFKAVSLLLVSSIAVFNNFCFWLNSSVLVGSSFNNLLTSFNSLWVVFIAEFVSFNALWSLVVSPPISTVIPAILLFAISQLQKDRLNAKH